MDNSGAIGLNYFYDGAYKYVGNSTATLYSLASGQHRWYTAASGTAGNAISFGDAKMTLDASGRLLLGRTSGTYGVDLTSPDGNLFRFTRSTDELGAFISSNVAFFGGVTNTPLAFITNNTERARITAGGNLGVNCAGTNARLEVNAASGEIFRADAGAALRIVANQDGAVFGGNIALGVSTSFGGGSRVVAIREAETVPSTNPVGNGILYVEAGALKYRGTSGTVTTIANA
jgi:hypothetical protein